MLPKCVLRASRRGGRHCKHPSIEQLCSLWSQGDSGIIWNRINKRPVIPPQKQSLRWIIPPSAIGLSREGLLGRACQALVSRPIPQRFGICSGRSILEVPILPCPSLRVLLSITCCHMTLTFCQFSIPSPKVEPGLSGLHIQHLLDAAQVHLPTPICSPLRGVVDILASGRAPVSVSKFLAGGSLTALVKNKEGRPLDIHPIVVGEALRHLTGKCLCIITKPKASDFFTPFQYGVACPAGAEKVIHGVRSCIQEHWKDDNFTVCKVDMSGEGKCDSNPFQVAPILKFIELCSNNSYICIA